jgi:hypothetical protein
MLADTQTGTLAYSKLSGDTESGSVYTSASGIGGAGNPNKLFIRHELPLIPGNGKGVRRTLVSLSGPLRDSAGAVALAERVTINLTITHPNVNNDGVYIGVNLLDLLKIMSNATAVDTFADNVVAGMN